MIHRRIISTRRNVEYYVPVDHVNVGDHLHVTDPSPGLMKGYGGHPFKFDMNDGTNEVVIGPWHTNSLGLLKDTDLQVGELHFTQVTLKENDHEGALIYDEKEMVLGSFHRGQRIAQQLADIRDKPIYVHVETNEGSHSHTAFPKGHEHYNEKYNGLHPIAQRKGDAQA